jgi:hypothetical protein
MARGIRPARRTVSGLTGCGDVICRVGLIRCCAGLAACATAAPNGPATAVTTPAWAGRRRPRPPQAALSAEAFTPYAGLGASTDDGLAPGDTYAALHAACMTAAGYGQYAGATPFAVRENRGLAFAQPFGPSLAQQQEGRLAPPGRIRVRRRPRLRRPPRRARHRSRPP